MGCGMGKQASSVLSVSKVEGPMSGHGDLWIYRLDLLWYALAGLALSLFPG